MTSDCYVKQLSDEDFPKNPSRKRTITWICLPYLSIEPYSGIRSVTQSGDYPIRTLLQARRGEVRRQREMQQAVCQNGDAAKGECVHVAQVWCVILDDFLLITCARSPLEALGGSLISVQPSATPPSSTAFPPRVVVSYGDAVQWSFRIHDCWTWFALLTQFLEFWPQRYQIRQAGSSKLLTRHQWRAIRDNAMESGKDIYLTFQLGSAHESGKQDKNIPKSNLNSEDWGSDTEEKKTADELHRAPETQINAPEVDVQSVTADANGPTKTVNATKDRGSLSQSNDGPFHVYSWLSAQRLEADATFVNADKQRITKDLETMHSYLSKDNNSSVDRLAYNNCPESTHSQDLEIAKSKASETKYKEWPWNYEGRVDLFNAAESVFLFFLPRGYDGPTVPKFWGAIREMLRVRCLSMLK